MLQMGCSQVFLNGAEVTTPTVDGLFDQVKSLADLFPVSGVFQLVLDYWQFPVSLLFLFWLIQLLSWIFESSLLNSLLGVHAWNFIRFWGILTHPLAHGGWGHLFGNTIPFLIFGSIVAGQGNPPITGKLAEWGFLNGLDRFSLVTLTVALAAGLGAFIFNVPGKLTVGASGVVFGYFGYIMVMAWRLAEPGQMIIASILAIGWGFTMLKGIVPRFGSRVSWQAHLSGLLGGGALAWFLTIPTLN